jgi:Xaa-Pro aminopeptidase
MHRMMKTTENLLMVADSEQDANMLYAVGMFVPDPFVFLRIRGRNYAVMSDLEIDRARQQARHCQVLSVATCQSKLREHGVKQPGFAAVVRWLLREKGVASVLVPGNFPLGLASQLQKLGIRVRARAGSFFPERERKSPAEAAKIRAALRMAEAGMAEGIQALKRARIGRDQRLRYRGAPLTSERLRAIIDTAMLQRGGVATRSIVAGGRQGCDPHEPGHGPLRGHETIILDLFPRSQKTGYFGDITRTVVRGRAGEAIRKLYQTVLEGQTLAFTKIRANVATQAVHRAVQEFFDRQGYKTTNRSGRMEGFFHGTGHGLGLEIHEPPRLGATSPGVLKTGHVVTVEPGLYYPDIGGVRLEDVAWVRDAGYENLTRFPKVLELR